jgi:hypothetical protein
LLDVITELTSPSEEAMVFLALYGSADTDNIFGADPDNADEVLLWTACERAD